MEMVFPDRLWSAMGVGEVKRTARCERNAPFGGTAACGATAPFGARRAQLLYLGLDKRRPRDSRRIAYGAAGSERRGGHTHQAVMATGGRAGAARGAAACVCAQPDHWACNLAGGGGFARGWLFHTNPKWIFSAGLVQALKVGNEGDRE